MARRRVGIGIATHEQLRKRAADIAAGRRRRRADEPKIWFTSLESLARVLSAPNRRLLRIIAERRPGSLTELEALSGRRVSNLSRTLKTMSRYGLVRLGEGRRGRVLPEVVVKEIRLDLPLV
jgi:predicted transcriptional regulator